MIFRLTVAVNRLVLFFRLKGNNANILFMSGL